MQRRGTAAGTGRARSAARGEFEPSMAFPQVQLHSEERAAGGGGGGGASAGGFLALRGRGVGGSEAGARTTSTAAPAPSRRPATAAPRSAGATTARLGTSAGSREQGRRPAGAARGDAPPEELLVYPLGRRVPASAGGAGSAQAAGRGLEAPRARADGAPERAQRAPTAGADSRARGQAGARDAEAGAAWDLDLPPLSAEPEGFADAVAGFSRARGWRGREGWAGGDSDEAGLAGDAAGGEGWAGRGDGRGWPRARRALALPGEAGASDAEEAEEASEAEEAGGAGDDADSLFAGKDPLDVLRRWIDEGSTGAPLGGAGGGSAGGWADAGERGREEGFQGRWDGKGSKDSRSRPRRSSGPCASEARGGDADAPPEVRAPPAARRRRGGTPPLPLSPY